MRDLKHIVSDEQIDAVLVAGDVFHAQDVDDQTMLKAADAIGSLAVPVVMIPGNHDVARAGSLWERSAWQQRVASHAPNRSW